MAKKDNIAAVILAAGSGSRMKSDIKKQFILIAGKPLIYYSIKAFQDSFADEITLVVSKEDIQLCKEQIVEKYGFDKVKNIVAGGKERYDSVYSGLKACDGCDYVMIHDGARPFVDTGILNRAYEGLRRYGNAVAAMPVKDTIKVVDDDNFVLSTPNRNSLWQMQTPQCFEYRQIYDAYTKLIENKDELIDNGVIITDDAMVLEYFTDTKIKLTEGSYNNIKITTAEDLALAEGIIRSEL